MKYLMETQLALDKDQHITKMVIKTNSDLLETQALDILVSKIKTMNFLKNWEKSYHLEVQEDSLDFKEFSKFSTTTPVVN